VNFLRQQNVNKDQRIFNKNAATAAVLVSQAEAIVRSLTNMAAADLNGYLKSKSNYMLNINNRRTKHYTYSNIHMRTFTKTEPVSLSNPTMLSCLLFTSLPQNRQNVVTVT